MYNNNQQSTSQNHLHSARIQADLAMSQSLQRSQEPAYQAIPENTRKAYEPKIKEFRKWCDEKFPHEAPEETRYTVQSLVKRPTTFWTTL